MEPFQERIWDVISEEFSQQGLLVRDLPNRTQEALKNIAQRMATDLEFTAQHGGEIVD